MSVITDHKKRAFRVEVTLIQEVRPDCEFKLAAGYELFVVADNQPIMRPGYVGPDNVLIMGAKIADGHWPILLCPVRLAHVDQWAKLCEPGLLNEQVAYRMVERARRALIAREAGR